MIETDPAAATKMLDVVERESARHGREMSARTKKLLSQHPELNSPDLRVLGAAMTKIFTRQHESLEDWCARMQQEKKETPITLIVFCIFVAFVLFARDWPVSRSA